MEKDVLAELKKQIDEIEDEDILYKLIEYISGRIDTIEEDSDDDEDDDDEDEVEDEEETV